MKSFICLFSFSLLVFDFALAQPDTLWTRVIDVSGEDACVSICQTSDGGFFLGGFCNHYVGPPPYNNYYSAFGWAKVNSNGTAQWTGQGTVGISSSCATVIQDSSGPFMLAGYLDGDFHLKKVNYNGGVVWERSYGGEGDDWCFSMAATSNSRYLLVGQTQSFGNPAYPNVHGWAICVNTNGDSLWSRTFETHGDTLDSDKWESVVTANDGGFYLVDWYIRSNPSPHAGILIERITDSGDSIWCNEIYSSYWVYPRAACLASDGGCVVVGDIAPIPHYSQREGFALKVSEDGDSIWSISLNADADSYFHSVASSSDGGYLITGRSVSNMGSQTPWIVKLSAEGLVEWECHPIPGSSNNMNSIIRCQDGGYAIGGSSLYDNWLIRMDSETGVPDGIDGTAYKSNLSPSFPNPFNPATTISFSLPHAGNVSLAVYDVTGRKVETLIDKSVNAGEHHVDFDGSTLPSGLYFARLSAGEFTQTQKIVLLK